MLSGVMIVIFAAGFRSLMKHWYERDVDGVIQRSLTAHKWSTFINFIRVIKTVMFCEDEMFHLKPN